MSSAPDINEVILARKIRRALDEGSTHISDKAAKRLSEARAIAMSRKKAEPVKAPALSFTPALAGMQGATSSAGASGQPTRGRKKSRLVQRLQLWVPLTVLLASLFGIAHWEEQRRVAEMATLDAEVLSDTLPLDAYLDHGFNEYLARNR